jgi:predicted RNA-binding Zn ribbon-like protein
MAPPFEWIGNHPVFDFTNTVSWRHAGLANERLLTYLDLLRWSREAGTLPPAVVARLARGATAHPAQAQRALDTALELRAALHGSFSAMARGKPAAAADLAAINRILAEALPRLGLKPAGRGVGLDWKEELDDLSSPLWALAWLATRLVMTEDLPRMGRCANDECGWLFLDTSRGGRRKWCVMDDCGNRAKVRRHRRRARASKPSPEAGR